MNAIDYIKLEMGMSKGWIGALMADMKDSPLTLPTPNGGNHPLWIVGHMAYSESNILNSYILGKENPLIDLKEKLSIGSQPTNDASSLPSYEEALEMYETARNNTLAYLDTLTDEDLDKPSNCPEEMRDYFGTIGQCLAVMTTHLAFHGGQIADARRAAGRDILMA